MTFAELQYKGLLGYYVELYQWNYFIWIAGFVVCAIAAYLLGSLNFALLISKHRFNEDIRKSGSGNAGMTNMMRTYGKSAAAFTLIGDAAKAAVAVWIGMLINGQLGASIAGLFCIIGHVFPIFFGFKGGKGVVTTAVMILCLSPRVFLVLLIIFVIIVATTKYISLGSIMCMLMYPLLLYNFGGVKDIREVIAIITAILVIWLHRGNIMRLKEGKENKFSFKKSVKAKKKEEPAAPEK